MFRKKIEFIQKTGEAKKLFFFPWKPRNKPIAHALAYHPFLSVDVPLCYTRQNMFI